MKKKKFGVPDILLLALSLFMALGAAFLFRPCARMADGRWMNCHKAGVALMWIGGGMAVLSLARALSGKNVRCFLDGALFALSLLYLLTPGTLIHLCGHPDARCQLYTRPAALVLGIVGCVLALCSLLTEWPRKKQGRRDR